MWIFNDDGFFSTVVDVDDHRRLAVRSRDRFSLVNFVKATDLGETADLIVETRERDYPYRIYADQDVWVRYMCDKADALDYCDFKSRMHERYLHGKFPFKCLKTLGTIWAVMYDGWEVRGHGDG